MVVDLLQVAAGVALLFFGGEVVVNSASALARRLGLSPLVIGLTVVAFGTSSPELATTLTAGLQGSPDVALGNVVGSNIANIGLVLGVAAILCPLVTHEVFLRREVPFMLACSAGMLLVVRDGRIGRFEGLVMLVVLATYLWLLVRHERRHPEVPVDIEGTVPSATVPLWRSVLGVVAGLVLLSLGARSLITGAVDLAIALGVSERVVGLTVVAFGTSLPELAATIVAARRKWADFILGSLIGSNIFNILFILGTTSVVVPLTPNMTGVWIDLFVMCGFSLVIWPFLRLDMKMTRIEGAILVAGYGAYIAWLFVR